MDRADDEIRRLELGAVFLVVVHLIFCSVKISTRI